MKKLLASLILLSVVINILPAASSMSDGVSVEYIPAAYNLGIGYKSPSSKLHVNGQIMMANGTTACSTAIEGSQRYNSTIKAMQFCNGTSWSAFGASGTVPSFHVHRNGVDQTITDIETDVDWTTELFDNTNAFNLITNRFTPQVAGNYLIIWQMGIVDVPASGDDDEAECTLYKNTTLISQSFTDDTAENTVYITATCATIVALNGSTDYIKAKVRFLAVDTGHKLEGTNGLTYMTGVKVSD